MESVFDFLLGQGLHDLRPLACNPCHEQSLLAQDFIEAEDALDPVSGIDRVLQLVLAPGDLETFLALGPELGLELQEDLADASEAGVLDGSNLKLI